LSCGTPSRSQTPAGPVYADADRDGYGGALIDSLGCIAPGARQVRVGGDCNDSKASVNPGAAEVCGDGIDNDCNNAVDEVCSTCPCWTAASLDAAFTQFSATTYNSFFEETCGGTASDATFAFAFFQGLQSDGSTMSYLSNYFDATLDTEVPYCAVTDRGWEVNQTSGSVIYDYTTPDRQEGSVADIQQCAVLLREAVARHSMVCQ
jgi:hypothetical protein